MYNWCGVHIYAMLVANFTTSTVLVCVYEHLVLDGCQWTGSTKNKYTSVAWFTVGVHSAVSLHEVLDLGLDRTMRGLHTL
jgi:uncharacterized membrane protein YjdF